MAVTTVYTLSRQKIGITPNVLLTVMMPNVNIKDNCDVRKRETEGGRGERERETDRHRQRDR